MTKRIFLSICIVALAVFLASMLLIMGVLYDYFSQVQKNQLKMQAELAAHSIYVEGIAFFDEIDTSQYRITWIDNNGNVLYDSETDPTSMENHLEREEIREAVTEGYGESSRYSTTLMERQLYSAIKLPDSTVVRLSSEQNTIVTLILGMLQPICIVISVAIILSLVLASRLSRYIVKPLNELNLDNPLSNAEYEELTPLLRRIHVQQKQLRLQSVELQHKQDEFETATASMNEGLILLGRKGSILSMNPAASAILGISKDYTGYCLRDINPSPELERILTEANEGKRSEEMLVLQGRNYQIDGSPIISDGQVSGVAVLLFDVTEKERAEQMRREFTANVSHELKTPLHSISGYAELIANGIARPEDVGSFSEKIYSEAQRMIHLVEDILHLSRLDDGANDMNRIDTDLWAVCEEVARELTSVAELADVALILENNAGHDTKVNGIPQLLHGIVFNLCDNAIKYNQKGGKVCVSLSDQGDSVSITVSDTGIGIPEEHLERIFERFYRVDKSHSKDVGGTGLGLSIVKHAAKIHNAGIDVNSKVGEGTAITVTIPKTPII